MDIIDTSICIGSEIEDLEMPLIDIVINLPSPVVKAPLMRFKPVKNESIELF